LISCVASSSLQMLLPPPHSTLFPTRRSSDLRKGSHVVIIGNSDHPEVQGIRGWAGENVTVVQSAEDAEGFSPGDKNQQVCIVSRSEEHTSELQSRFDLVCRLLLEKKNQITAL